MAKEKQQAIHMLHIVRQSKSPAFFKAHCETYPFKSLLPLQGGVSARVGEATTAKELVFWGHDQVLKKIFQL